MVTVQLKKMYSNSSFFSRLAPSSHAHLHEVWMTIVESGWNIWVWLAGGGCG